MYVSDDESKTFVNITNGNYYIQGYTDDISEGSYEPSKIMLSGLNVTKDTQCPNNATEPVALKPGEQVININTDGGTASASRIIATVGQKIGTLPTISKPGVEFAGWYSDNKFTNEITSETIVTSELKKLYAKFNYTYASLIKGTDLRDTFKMLSGQSENQYGYYATNDIVTSIQRSATLKDGATKISATDSANDVYAWYENGVIYYYSEANKLLLNADSKYAFSGFSLLTNIDIEDFDTSNVTNMEGLFSGFKGSTLDVSHFNTSNVTDMSYIFQSTKLNSLDVSDWDTSSATTMQGMFMSAENLESVDLSTWDTSNVETMEYMFQYSKIKHINLKNWNTSKVKNMYSMFGYMPNLLSLDISTFTNDNLENCEQMFYQVQGLKEVDLSGWHTSKLKNAYYMFGNSEIEKVNISNWDFSSYNSNFNPWYNMFSYGKLPKGKELIARNNTNVKGSCYYAFSQNRMLEKIDITGSDTSQITNMSNMFYGNDALTQIIGLNTLDTSNVTNMSYMFAYLKSMENLDLSSFNTEKVTNMSSMFSDSSMKTIDLSSFNTSNVTDMGSMFSSLPNLTTVYVGNNWSTIKVTSSSLFWNVPNLVGGQGTTFDSDIYGTQYAHVDGGETNPGYFTSK